MRVFFCFLFFFSVLYSTVYSQGLTVSSVASVEGINTPFDDFAPRVINNELQWIENSGSYLRKKSKILNANSSQISVYSNGYSIDVYASSTVIARPFQTEEFLSMQLYPHSNNNDESLPLFPEFTYCSQPSVSPSGNVLYFSGKSIETSSSTDLFISYKLNGKWQSPVVLSSKINSELFEITPFAISDDTLIFASNGLGGKGGYDLFIVSKDGTQWNDPLPLTDLNSAGNDSDPFVTTDGTIYFASDRKGLASGYDIYSATIAQQSLVSKEIITYFPEGIEVLRASSEELLPIPTIIPLPWLVSPPSISSTEFALYEEWSKTIGLIAFQNNEQPPLISVEIASSVAITPSIVTKIRGYLKNVSPLLRPNTSFSENILAITSDQVQHFTPVKISNSTQKLLSPHVTFFWKSNDFDAVQWEVNLATNSLNLPTFTGKCLPDEQSFQIRLDSVFKLISTEDHILNCVVYLINEQSEVMEKSFSIPIIRSTISKTGKSNTTWNNFYVYFGTEEAKRNVYLLYTQSILEAAIAKEIQIEYSPEYKTDVEIFQKLLENSGKRVKTKQRISRYPQESGAYILESTMMTISFP